MMNTMDILLVGPIVYSEITDHLRHTTTLVVSTSKENLGAYCHTVMQNDPSLMPKCDRWEGDIIELKAGTIELRYVPEEVDILCTDDVANRSVFFDGWQIMVVCLPSISDEEIEEVLRNHGLPDVM